MIMRLGFLIALLFALPIGPHAAEFTLEPAITAPYVPAKALYRSFYHTNGSNDLPERRAQIDRRIPPPGPRETHALYHVRLSGRIEKGDLAKLQKLLEYYDTLDKDWYTFSLTLDSPGGDFREGIAIGHWLGGILDGQDSNFIGSTVRAGDECLSACALIFALSTHRRMLDDSDRANYIEVGGRLGFHMGVMPDNLSAQKIPIRDSMNLAYDVVAAYMTLIASQNSPPALLIEALKARDADSFFYVEASPRAYDLGFMPVAASPLSEALSSAALPLDHVRRMCAHLRDISQLPTSILTERYFNDFGSPEMVRDLFVGREGKVLRGQLASGESCLIGLTPNGNLMMDVTDQEVLCASGTDHTEQWCAIDQENTFDHRLQRLATNALLADISGCPMGRLHPRMDPDSQIMSDPKTLKEEFGLLDITREVTLRSAPSLQAPKRGVLTKGEVLRLRDCAITLDNQAVWLRVDRGDISGWISARFARVRMTGFVDVDFDFDG